MWWSWCRRACWTRRGCMTARLRTLRVLAARASRCACRSKCWQAQACCCLTIIAVASADPAALHVKQCAGLQGEARRYLAALESRAQVRGSAQFSMAELISLSDSLDLNVPDVYAFLDGLNEAGTRILPVCCSSR